MGEANETASRQGEFQVIMDDDRHFYQAEKTFRKMGPRIKPNGVRLGFSVVPDGEEADLKEAASTI